jgi:phospholipid/cholesterol/gamma-HCH transport system substrate-binding protein
MNQHLSRSQAVALGLVVLLTLGLAGTGLFTLSAKHGFGVRTVELAVQLPEVNDVYPGTAVRMNGIDVGQVQDIRFAEEGTGVRVTLKVREEFKSRLYADASAQIRSTGLLGSKIVELVPGKPEQGPLNSDTLRAGSGDPMTEATARLGKVVEKVEKLVENVEAGKGTVGKLLTDDSLYYELKGVASDSRLMIQKTEGTVQKVEGQVGNVEKALQDGRETARAAKNTLEGVNQSWIGRRFLEDQTALLVRPRHRKEAITYNSQELFEPNSAVLTSTGRHHLTEVASWLKGNHPSAADVVVVALCDPNDRLQTSSSALELTRKQSEAAVEFLKAQGAHKMSWVSKRKFTSLGLGQGPSPVVELEPLPASYLQVLLFTPQ